MTIHTDKLYRIKKQNEEDLENKSMQPGKEKTKGNYLIK